MSRLTTETDTDAWDYVAYRGELLAQLALSRLPEVDVFRPQVDGGWDYLIAAADGVNVAVAVRAFSSLRHGPKDVADVPELPWRVDMQLVGQARQSRTPVILFLFDADTEHGRFLRLDTLPAPAHGARTVLLSLPITNTIRAGSLADLLADVRSGGRRP